ncbi:MAG: hypothetical protein NWE83_05980 [Candidatus Bathyarchaeota archaeon]|nr:hypothetical protein [Candidatus Bathyarchaeota archaeon]
MIGLPFSRKYQKEMGFPKEGEVIEGFRVESVSIGHVAAYTEWLARYEYPTKLVVEGDGSVDDVKRAFWRFFDVEKTILSSYGNPYLCEPDKMYVQGLGGGRFRIEARGSCVRVLKSEPRKERDFDLEEVALRVYEVIFDNQGSVEVDGLVYLMERTPRANLRLLKIGGYTFLEQNPEKGSRWGKLAREGHQIL